MKKVFILSYDRSFNYLLINFLDKSRYDLVFPEVSVFEFYSYSCTLKCDICIFHSSYIKGYYNIFDMLLASSKMKIIYFSANMEIGSVYSAMQSARFYMTQPSKIQFINDLLLVIERDSTIIEAQANEINKLKEKCEEEELIKRAKLILMKKYKLTEESAYNKILKTAMNDRISKINVAKKIVQGVK